MFQPQGQHSGQHAGQRVVRPSVGAPVPQQAAIGAGVGQQHHVDLLNKLKHEFDQLDKQRQLFKRERDTYEHRIQQQIQDSSVLQQQIKEIERRHQAIKKEYAEEIAMLKLQIQSLGGTANQSANAQQPPPLSTAPASMANNTSSGANNSTNTGTFSSHGAKETAAITNGKSMLPTNFEGTKRRATMEHPELPPLNHKRPKLSASNEVPNLAAAPPAQPKTAMALPAAHNLPPIAVLTANNTNGTQPVQGQPVGAATANNNTTTTPVATVKTATASTSDAPKTEPGTRPVQPVVQGGRQAAGTAQTQNMSFMPQGVEVKGSDWVVCYNPAVAPRRLEVDLSHTLDHNSVVCCVEFSSDVRYLATGCNRAANIFDAETGEKVHTFADGNPSGGDLYIRSVCFSPDSKFLVTGAEDQTVKVWDIQTKSLRHTLEGHELDIYSLDFSSDGTKIVSGSGDRKVKIWDMETGECLHTLGDDDVGPKDGVTSVSINNVGSLVSAGSLDNIVRLWDARNGFFLDRYEGHEDSVYSVAFSPDGKSLASGSLDRSVKIWDWSGRSRSRCTNTLTGHKDFVLSVAYSPDGRWLVSGSKDRSLQFWDPRTGVPHIILHGHSNSVISVALSSLNSDGSVGKFATGSGDFKSRIWKYTQTAETTAATTS